MKKISEISCLELFAGAGGLAKGLELSGIQHKALIEWNKDAYQTLINNYSDKLVHNVDIRSFQFDQFGHIDMVSGGPPCQPFSMGGKHKGNMDQRDMFPYACKAISTYTPKIFIITEII
jgi:DNA (cytosine-5)-methyltransferase 1